MKARQQREKKQQEYAKLSGLVVPKVKSKNTEDNNRKSSRYEDNDNDDDPTPHNIRGPVMHLTGKKPMKSNKHKKHFRR